MLGSFLETPPPPQQKKKLGKWITEYEQQQKMT